MTAAKVTLINRVDQVYEDDLSIKLQLVANNDLLNLDTWAQAIGPNGPCGAAACFTQSQVTGCSSTTRARFVIGQIIGASNYDIGHLALGQPGGGVANLGVVGRSNKAGGCTGIPTPIGDFYAVDYVAHEMGHQFSGNHPFNGNQLNCSGGNRNAATSVEPGSRLLDHGLRGHLPHRRPAGPLRPVLLAAQPAGDLDLHLVEPGGDQRGADGVAAALRRRQRGPDRHLRPRLRAGRDDPAAEPSRSAPSRAPPQLGGAQENGNTVTIATGAAERPHAPGRATRSRSPASRVAGYNGTFTVTSVPTLAVVQYTNPTTGLADLGRRHGHARRARRDRVRQHGHDQHRRGARPVGRRRRHDRRRRRRRLQRHRHDHGGADAAHFQYTAAASGLANSGGGTATFFSPFQVRIGGNDSAVIGGSGLPTRTRTSSRRSTRSPGFAGTVTVTGAASTGFTVTYAAPRPGSTCRTSRSSEPELRRLLRLRSRRRTTAARTTRSRSTTTATSRR